MSILLYSLNSNLIQELELKLCYIFNKKEILIEALTHPSCYQKSKDLNINYQRLEFLGDKILNLIISEILYKKCPDLNEAFLSIIHSKLANKSSIVKIAKSISLENYILMHKSEIKMQNNKMPNNLENTCEALIGAIFIDSKSYIKTKKIVLKLWNQEIKNLISQDLKKVQIKDYKTQLQEWSQKNLGIIPEYEIISSSGKDHQPTFTVKVQINDKMSAQGIGKSKKEGEQEAAMNFILQFKI